MKAVNNFVLVEKLEIQETTDTGIILPESQDTKSIFEKGKVLSVGDKVTNIEEGAIAWYDKRAAKPVGFVEDKKVLSAVDIYLVE